MEAKCNRLHTVITQKRKDLNRSISLLLTVYCLLIFVSNHLLDVEAVHRYYKSHHRLFSDEQPGQKELAIKVKEQSRKNTLQKRHVYPHLFILKIIKLKVCNNHFRLNNKRKNFLKKAQQCDFWSAICFLQNADLITSFPPHR